jgi:hypothetical protein
MSHSLCDVTAELMHETEKAFLLFDGKRKVWVPKNLVENNEDGTFTMPVWLAEEKELV